ncbi:hypothetical protein BS47DRAFT_1309122 [Hydnum rufescens UP504]|uniref:Uncharacterized protein n=1 Tax=Hydnum rufescens UP504 TaxID=1448309 RepID=A0A9P6DHE2_9AGAM|nr:hypothetical protein BS47DRAFT_1309122 [Hydnum rufescens UP504]
MSLITFLQLSVGSHVTHQYPHSVQQLMSGEATLILSGTLPAFQSLQNQWEEHMAKNPDVTPFVLEGME